MKSALIPFTLLASLLPQVASAREGAFDLGLGAGTIAMDPLEVLGTGPAFSPRVGYWVKDTFLIEADLGFGMGKTAVGTPDPFNFLSLTPRLNMVGRVWPDEALNVLFVAGIGVWGKKIDDGGELVLPQGEGMDFDMLGNAGPALMVPIGDTLALRSDLRWMISLGGENWENHGDAFMSWEITGGIHLVLGGTKDADKDGIADEDEGTLADGTSCVDKPEGPADGFKDEDGCPDPDNDEDGIPDDQEGSLADGLSCRDLPEGEPDAFQDDDGCPDPDDDGDGVLDVDEAPECKMISGVASAKGCPDADGDAIADTVDECERDAADASVGNAFGCPDGDKDNVPDYRDSCPAEAGAADASPFRSNGCATRVYPTEAGIKVTEPVAFQGTTGTWKATSNLLVDDISEVIKGVSSYKKLEIQVHSEGPKGDAKALEVAQKRADKMMEAIVKDGADASRLTAKGVEAPEVAGDGVKPNVFVAATDKQAIDGLKRKYDDTKEGPRRAPEAPEAPKPEAPKAEEKPAPVEGQRTGTREAPPAEAPAEAPKPEGDTKTGTREAPPAEAPAAPEGDTKTGTREAAPAPAPAEPTPAPK